MKSITNIILVLIFTAAGIAAQEKAKTADTSRDETAIRANVEQMVKGWNMKSGAEFAKPFAEDSDYVVINGFHIKGRAANAAGHQRIFDTIYKNSTLAYTVENIRFVRFDVAVVHVLAMMKMPQGNSTQTFNARITMVMVRNEGKWEITAFQNTAIEQTGGK